MYANLREGRNQPTGVLPAKIASGISSGLALCALLVIALGSSGFAQTRRAAPDKASGDVRSNSAARGKYIVEGLAICSQCHTPRDSHGSPDRSHWLEGAPVWLTPAEPTDDWPIQAPRIAGTLPGSDAEMVTLLTTGIWRDGKFLRPPMPQFRMNKQDAEAVVAYLKSLKPTPR
jgi:mono/diheme cytochrome c family protein